MSIDVGIRHLAFVELTVKIGDGVSSVILERWEVVDVLRGREVKKVSFEDTIQCVLEFLDDTFIESDIVLIENQPCMKNPRLKSIQMVIYTYFRTMNMCKANFPSVRLVTASVKLQGLTNAPLGLIPARASSMTYAAKKKASVVACEHYLRNVIHDECNACKFSQSKVKKDDLADCMLQAMAYIEKTFKNTANIKDAHVD